MLKKLFAVLGFAAVVMVIVVGGGVGKLVGREVASALASSSKPTQADLDAAMIEAFRETAETVNAGLPKMIDEVTRLDKATVGPGPRMVYHNTLIGYTADEIDREWIHSSLRPHVQGNVCASAGMRSSLEYGAIYSYAYYGSDGVRAGDFEIDRTDCGFEAKTP